MNFDLSEKFSNTARIDIPADGVRKVSTIPSISGLTRTYFLTLSLADSTGKQVSSNFYWLSTQPDTLDWNRSTWYYTPASLQADFTALQKLPPVDLLLRATSRVEGATQTATITIENGTRNLAFMVHLKLMRPRTDSEEQNAGHINEVLPALWEDNYFSLLPGEKRQIHVNSKAAADPNRTVVQMDGWNVVPNSAIASTE